MVGTVFALQKPLPGLREGRKVRLSKSMRRITLWVCGGKCPLEEGSVLLIEVIGGLTMYDVRLARWLLLIFQTEYSVIKSWCCGSVVEW